MILEENDFDQYINKEVLEPGGDEAKVTHKKNLVKAKRIIADLLRITPSPMCHPSRHRRKYLML